jgi:hypothetical protein
MEITMLIFWAIFGIIMLTRFMYEMHQLHKEVEEFNKSEHGKYYQIRIL